jgi:hypothetical protein
LLLAPSAIAAHAECHCGSCREPLLLALGAIAARAGSHCCSRWEQLQLVPGSSFERNQVRQKKTFMRLPCLITFEAQVPPA